MEQQIRPILKKDISDLKEVLNTIELFPPEYLEDMIADFFDNQETEDIWFAVEQEGKATALAYCTPEKFTEGTYNLLAIGVRADLQSKGLGAKMMEYLENLLREKGNRILIVETSGNLDRTQAFYLHCGYAKEAVIRDFWAEGDDKVVFWKNLSQ